MEKYYPLSKTEEGIYVDCLKETDAYNLGNVICLGKKLDVDKFINSVNDVFNKHPYLFTILFQGEDGNIYKKIKKIDLNLKLEEVSNFKFKSIPYKMLN